MIPVFNEDVTIRELIARVQMAPLPAELEKEIVVVDDFSVDGTREILEQYGRDRNRFCKVFFHDRNRGKGAASGGRQK